jgi:hypothetical protein
LRTSAATPLLLEPLKAASHNIARMMYRNASLPDFQPTGTAMDPSVAARKRRLAVEQLVENMRRKQPRADTLSCGSSLSDESDTSSSDEEADNMASRALKKANFGVAVPHSVLNRAIELASQKVMHSASTASLASESAAIAHRAKLHAFKSSRLTTSMPKISDGLTCIHQSPRAATTTAPKPDSVLKTMIEQAGYVYETFDALNMKGFFVEVTEDVVKAYEMDVIKALRENDLPTLRDFYKAGRQLQCANKFGDSIIHTACRRGSLEIVQFLLKEAGLSCKVCCDYGRTSLHDACWTSSPNFQVIDELLDACPDLLYTKDKRGFTPLDYARPAQYGDWCKYLAERGAARLLPKELEFQRFTESQD